MKAPQLVKTEQIVMVVKAYPTPSEQYGELTCTAGIRIPDFTWVRIYPYPFRSIEPHYRFRKWDVVEAPLQKSLEDPRPDSYRLYDVEGIRFLKQAGVGDPFWTMRMQYIRKTAVSSVEELMSGMLLEGNTWGRSILPVPVMSGSGHLSWEYRGSEWSPDELKKLTKVKSNLEQNMFVSERFKNSYKVLKKPGLSL